LNLKYIIEQDFFVEKVKVSALKQQSQSTVCALTDRYCPMRQAEFQSPLPGSMAVQFG
jgi:hypothetical protein